MPRYRYQCTNCQAVISVFHMISESCTDCDSCSHLNTMQKMLTRPVLIKQDVADNKEIGDLTKEYIEANREILENEKAKSNTYEPS